MIVEARFKILGGGEDRLVRIFNPGNGLEIAIEGLSDYWSDTGDEEIGVPIYLELHEGKVRLLVWADINQEDPTHIIDLSGAAESARKPITTDDE